MLAEGYTIRSAEADDIEALARLKYRGDEFHLQFDLWPSEMDMDEARRGMRKLLDDPENMIHIAVDNSGNVVGFIRAGIMKRDTVHDDYRNVGEIGLIFIEPDHRNKGIGKALVKAVIEEFDSMGILHVTLRVVVYNEAGIRFWESLSFENKIISKASTVAEVKNQILRIRK